MNEQPQPMTAGGRHTSTEPNNHAPFRAAGHDPASSGVHGGVLSKQHTQARSAGHPRPEVSTRHDAFFSENHDPVTSWIHDGVFSAKIIRRAK